MRRCFAIIPAVLVASATLAYAATQVVGQKGRLFSPGTMTVRAGESVLFKNDDTVTHHIYSSTKGHEFNLQTAEPGKDAKHTFAKPGRVDVRCGLHPGMRLVVTVQ